MNLLPIDPNTDTDEMQHLLNQLGETQRAMTLLSRQFGEQLVTFRDKYLTVMAEESSASMDYRSMLAELALKLKISEVSAGYFVDHADALNNRFSEVGRAIDEDHITFDQAKIILEIGATVPEENQTEFMRKMLTKACGVSWAIGEGPAEATVDEHGDRLGYSVPALRRIGKKYKETSLTPQQYENLHHKALENRRVNVEPADNGMAWLHLYMSATDASAIFDGLTNAAKALRPLISDNPAQFGYSGGDKSQVDEYVDINHNILDLPTLNQLRLDIAQDLLLSGKLDTSKELQRIEELYRKGQMYRTRFSCIKINPTVHITVPALSLLGKDTTFADLAGYGPIGIDMARKLCALAPSFVRILTHPETGAVLSVGRTSYRAPTSLRNELMVRDQRCRWPGCGVPVKRCDLDHTIPWQYEGKTEKQNLAFLCRRHHVLKHFNEANPNSIARDKRRWEMQQLEDAAIVWTSPLGQTVTTRPEEIPATKAPPRVVWTTAPF